MKNFVIAYISFFDNENKIYFIKAKTVKEAILNTVEKDNKKEMNRYLPDTEDEIRDFYGNSDAAITIKEIPKDFLK